MISIERKLPFASKYDGALGKIIHDSFFERAVYVMTTKEFHESRCGMRTRVLYETRFENQNNPWRCFTFPTNSMLEIDDIVALVASFGGSVVTYQKDHPLSVEYAKAIAKISEERDREAETFRRYAMWRVW